MPGTSVAHKTVVIADDTPLVRDRFKAALEHAGHRAVTARSAAELLARVRAELTVIDLIVVDLRLPHADGVELVRAIRKLDGGTAPHPGLQRDHLRRRRGPGPRRPRRRRLRQRVQRRPSTSCHRSPRICSRTTSTAAAARGSSLGIPVAYRFADSIAAAVTLNLSKGGLAIRTMGPLDVSSRVRVRFRLPNSKRTSTPTRRVTWSDRRVGMGLQFERIDPADQAAIDEFVDQYFGTRRAGS